jgi:hypothetical protein
MTPSCENRISLHIEIIYHVSTRRGIFKLTERRRYRLAVAFLCFMAKRMVCICALHCEMCRRMIMLHVRRVFHLIFKKPGQKLVQLSFILIYSSVWVSDKTEINCQLRFSPLTLGEIGFVPTGWNAISNPMLVWIIYRR